MSNEERPDRRLLSPTTQRGTLKVYVGAAVGVGKTYRMLEDARHLRAAGRDVVLGYIETHGRAETAALMEGLETVPLREVPHRGATLREMDIDAILVRKPEIAIVDELAHSNAPGSRNPKRYQDVQALLEARIDVITALNIQHLESLNHIVQRLIGVIVKETVPDSLLTRADEVVDVDVSVEELRGRLRGGKIYPIEQVTLALRNFFQTSNLSLLRELTLREVAHDIGRHRENLELLKEPRARRLTTGGPVLVCLPSDPRHAEELLCKGWREAIERDSEWYAIHVETPEESLQKISPAKFRALLENVNLAGDLGAEFVWFKAEDVVDAIVAFAQEKDISKIIVGRSRRSVLSRLFRASTPERFIREARGLDVEVLRDESGAPLLLAQSRPENRRTQ
jgi:two-component system, OmpR family, sensor histidine kinase KdpD